MIDRLKLSLSGVWMIASLSALMMPVFLPSFTGAHGFKGNAIAVSAVTMFILSFPSSVVATPLIILIDAVLDLTDSSIAVAYMHLIMLFVVGLFQWFWAVPRLFGRRTVVEGIDLQDSAVNPHLFARDRKPGSAWVDAKGTTPLERVLREDSNSESA